MSEPEALQKRHKYLLEQLSRVADEIKRVDDRLSAILVGNRGQGGAGAA